MSGPDIGTQVPGFMAGWCDIYTKYPPGGTGPPPVETFYRITGDNEIRDTGDSDHRVIGT